MDRHSVIHLEVLGHHRRRTGELKVGRRRVWRRDTVVAWLAAQEQQATA